MKIDTTDCNTFNCPLWSSWIGGECSVSCGSGKMTSSRDCFNHENRIVANGQCGSGAASKVEVCNTEKCPIFQYGEWSECSKTCGTGTKRRTGTCFYNGTERPDSLCPGNSVEKINCNTETCPRWTKWRNWSDCSHTCGGGSQSRTRNCFQNRRRVSKYKCSGEPKEIKACNLHSCPSWSTWGNWRQWSQSCGKRKRVKYRECYYQNQKTRRSMCDGKRYKIEENNIQCPEWDSWSDWTPCSKSCGSGLKFRKRNCYQNGAAVDSAACSGDDTLRKYCNFHDCPSWKNWSPWTGWSQSCGNMTRTQTRPCLYNNNYVEDKKCSGPSIKHAQRFIKCPSWDNWESWNPCSVSCGTGRKSRSRKCLFQNFIRSASLCEEGSDKESENCSEESCPTWSEFTSWSSWSAGWGVVKRSKSRFCRNDIRDFDPNECVGENVYSETKTIIPPKWSNWMAWSKCSKVCGPQSIERKRFCFFNGTEMTPMKSTCGGSAHETKQCETKPCKSNASWGSWYSWTQCSTTCGRGSKYKYRDCLLDKEQGANP